MTTEEPILVTSYVNPDLDGMAGIVAYSEFLNKTGINAIGGFFGEPQNEAKFVFDYFKIDLPRRFENAENFDQIILIDASTVSDLEGKVSPEKVIEIVDHRQVHEADKFPKAKVQIELVGAVATLIAEKFQKQDLEISEASAKLLCAAIISNTFSFKGGVTTQRDRGAFKWLSGRANLPENFAREMFLAKSNLGGDKLQKVIRDDFIVREWSGGQKVGIGQIEMIGAKNLIDQRGNEILEELIQFKKVNKPDFYFLSVVELEEGNTFFITDDRETQQLLEQVFKLKFDKNVAVLPRLIIRKEVVPLLKSRLENNL